MLILGFGAWRCVKIGQLTDTLPNVGRDRQQRTDTCSVIELRRRLPVRRLWVTRIA